VINARVDVFLYGGTPADAITRGRAYRRAGADCVYPILAPTDQLAEVVEGVGGPINAHAAPGGPTVADLVGAGATRISYGTSLHKYVMDHLVELLPQLNA
jgi:2-methylisocitrate lyase-like PEP mutase family enzyme